MINIEEKLAYSFHLGSDKNKRNTARNTAKNNNSKTTSYSNNAIQNLNQLSRVDKHNYRKYDNNQDDIVVIKGTTDLIKDVKDLYIQEFESARIIYNERQLREDRKINDYFMHISNNLKNDLACEIIIELGDKKYWDTKNKDFKKKMTDVYSSQIKDLELIVPTFKVASAIIHYDETSPHMHIVGVPIKKGNKNGMSKQVGKTSVFTKDSLKNIQDKMRIKCIENFNYVYNLNNELKTKNKGRNFDINVNDMESYQHIKDEIEKNKVKLEEINNKTMCIKNNTKDIENLINNLKQSKLYKSNYIITEKDKAKITEYISNIKTSNEKFNKISKLYISLNEIKNKLDENKRNINSLISENKQLKYEVESKNNLINNQKETIIELKDENYYLKSIIYKLKKQLKKIKQFLQEKIFGYGKKKDIYKDVANDFINNNIFTEKELLQKEKNNLEL